MADRNLSLADDGADDLPRTFRREREAREREAREREVKSALDPGLGSAEAAAFRDEPQAAVVTALRIPFMSLVAFFLKAVFAAVPALFVLGVMLWGVGQILTTHFPWLVKLKILISIPN